MVMNMKTKQTNTMNSINALDSLIELLIKENKITNDGNRDELDAQLWTRLNDIRELLTTGEVV